MKPNFSKGLLPAVVIEEDTKEVLMLAYMNEEAYEKTIETKRTWFYSRSRRFNRCCRKASRACMSYGRKNMFSLQNYIGGYI